MDQTWFFLINVTLYAPLRYPVNYLHYKVGNGVDKNSRETSRSPRVAANESRDPEGERGSQRPSVQPASLFWTDHGDSNLLSAFLFRVTDPTATAQTELAEKSASKFAVGRPDWWADIFNCTFIPLFFFRADHLSVRVVKRGGGRERREAVVLEGVNYRLRLFQLLRGDYAGAGRESRLNLMQI